jgi:hypothetical protein
VRLVRIKLEPSSRLHGVAAKVTRGMRPSQQSISCSSSGLRNSRMPIYDSGFKIVAHHAGRHLAHLGHVVVDAWQPLVSEVQTTERLADRAFRARRGGDRFVVYMEAYTTWTGSAPWSILAKSSLLAERERLPGAAWFISCGQRVIARKVVSFACKLAGGPCSRCGSGKSVCGGRSRRIGGQKRRF